MPRHLGSAAAVLREARLAAAVLREACLAAAVLREACLAAAVLREACLAAAVLREAMAGSLGLRTPAIITSDLEGRASSRDDLLRVDLPVPGDCLIHRIAHRHGIDRLRSARPKFSHARH
jgi:uncharacterized protein YjbI with pentapeptide repeats